MSGVTLGILWGWGGDGGNAIVSNNGMKLTSLQMAPGTQGHRPSSWGPHPIGLFCVAEFGNVLIAHSGLKMS